MLVVTTREEGRVVVMVGEREEEGVEGEEMEVMIRGVREMGVMEIAKRQKLWSSFLIFSTMDSGRFMYCDVSTQLSPPSSTQVCSVVM